MAQLTSDNIVTIADETIPLSEINDSDLFLFADSEGNFKKATIEEIVSKCYNDNILGKEKANVPLETPYVQLPNMPTPDTLYLGTWEDVSANYSNAFFRVIGDKSAEWEVLQLDQFQGHEHKTERLKYTGNGDGGQGSYVEGGWWETTTGITGKSGCGTPRYGDETRPMNYAIKVWKRTA